MSEDNIQKDKKESIKASSYASLSNKYFRKTSDSLIQKGYFRNLNTDLRKITSNLLLSSYISMMLLTTSLVFIAGLAVSIILFIFGVPFYIGLAALFGLPAVTFLMFNIYPSSQRKTLEKGINQELPFVVIYLSAIAISGIEPSRIFEVLARTKDYPITQREIKKLLNYINFYGFDLVSALKYSSRNCPSEKLAELFSGFASSISSGGLLTDFLSKHAETLLFDYKLEREKYTKTAETFMNIYISVVIAAPMILMMVMILMSMTGFGGNITAPMLSLITIFTVALLNVLFLWILGAKQPKF